jgi:prepilin-type processing-associated H-X9-DG protein
MAHLTDGATQTLLAGEKFLNPDNYSTGVDAGDKYCALGGWSYDNYRDASYKDSAGNALFMDAPSTSIPASCFGGPHSSGCQFVLCDGSVHNISFSIDLTTYRNLANRRDNQPIDDSKWK